MFFSEKPGCTTTIKHDIELTSTDRIKSKVYPIPINLRPYFDVEVDDLPEQGVIRLPSSPHCSPVVMVKKADGSYRMTIDYRALNSVKKSFMLYHLVLWRKICTNSQNVNIFPSWILHKPD